MWLNHDASQFDDICGNSVCSFGGAVYRATHELPAAALPEPLLVDLAGHSHHLSEWKGKVLVVNFWASWCKPCRDEMKEFSKLQSTWEAQGLQFVGIAIDDPANVRAYLKDNPVSYPIWVGVMTFRPGRIAWVTRSRLCPLP